MNQTQTQSTSSVSEPTTIIFDHSLGSETLRAELEAGELYMSLRSPGCSPILVRSVEEAVAFTMPELTVNQHLTLTREILDALVSTLNRKEPNKPNKPTV